MPPLSSAASAVPSLLTSLSLTPVLAVEGDNVLVAVGLLVLGSLGGLIGSRFLARRGVDDAQREARASQQRVELERREALADQRERIETELAADRRELEEKEDRLEKREDRLDQKLETLSERQRELDASREAVDAAAATLASERDAVRAERERQQQHAAEFDGERTRELLRIGKLDAESARREAMDLLQQQCDREAAELIKATQEQAQATAKEQAQKIILQAIQRYASPHTATSVTNAVKFDDDAMKSRIIGREGRNIRAFQEATGVSVIVDDTPGQVQISCFDPVRRAAATSALQRLLADGRIHAHSIETVVREVNEEFDQKVRDAGREAALEVHLPDLHPRVTEMMGRLHYRTSYGQNILRHSIEVAFLSQAIAEELRLDGATARRAGFLHDIGKAMDHDVEGTHPRLGAEFLRKHHVTEEAVLNAVEGHHNDIVATTPYTPIVMAADAISGARPGARQETLEKYIKRLQSLEDLVRKFDGVQQVHIIQAGREVRVIVDPRRVNDEASHKLARKVARQISEEMTFPGEIKVTLLRELRTVEFAR